MLSHELQLDKTRWRCLINNLIYCQKKIMTGEIVIEMNEKDLIIWNHDKFVEKCKYTKLGHGCGEQLLADGLKIEFRLDDKETSECVRRIDGMIKKRLAGKKERKSGPTNTLTKSFKETKLPLSVTPHVSPSRPVIFRPTMMTPPLRPNITERRSRSPTITNEDRTKTLHPPRILDELPQSKNVKNVTSEPRLCLPPAVPKVFCFSVR